MKVVAIVQARMGSTRLPGKVMKDLGGTPLIGVLLARLARAERVNQIVVATSVDSGNLPLKAYVESLGYVCEQGSEKDVLQRYADIAKKHQADVVVRVTGDCPLVDPLLVDTMISGYLAAGTEKSTLGRKKNSKKNTRGKREKTEETQKSRNRTNRREK